MERNDRDRPLPPFFEFSPVASATMSMPRPWQRRIPPSFDFHAAGAVVAYVLDEPDQIRQEPPELEEFGPDKVFDSRGRRAELRVEDVRVVVKGWSEAPRADLLDSLLRAAGPFYMPEDEVRTLGFSELRDRLASLMRQRQREDMLWWPVENAAQKLVRLLSRSRSRDRDRQV